jgi:glycosyltransferase involved in cell wall biosynthesis
VEEKFSWTAIADQTIELYRKLIESRRRSVRES